MNKKLQLNSTLNRKKKLTCNLILLEDKSQTFNKVNLINLNLNLIKVKS